MLAVDQMDPELQAIFFLIAVVLFVLGALAVVAGRINLVAAGLAFFVFVFFWNALAAS
jgi:hypothetical protein